MRWKSDLILLAAAFVWGSGFVAQRFAALRMSTFAFNGWRFLIAALVIFLFTTLTHRKNMGAASRIDRKQIPWMILAGALLFLASGLQQAGLATTSIGNASFITGLYVVLVPLILSLIWRHQVSWLSWVAVGLSVIGVMLLSLQGELRFSSGDVLELAGALMWAFQIILVGWLAGRGVNVLQFSIIQFATCGFLNLVLAVGLDPNGVMALEETWQAVVYSALFPIAMGFSLQIMGQRHAPPVDASIIMSTEAVFGTLFGFFFLGELLNFQQLMGCALIMAAMIMAQLRSPDTLNLDTA